MEGQISINTESCIKCGKCARICPSLIITQEEKGSPVKVQNVENCIACGHCVAVCPTGSVLHSEFPAEKVHPFKYSDYPTPEQMMLVCKARRSNRAFSKQPIPQEALKQIIEAAHRAPTASNMQQVYFTLVTDPEQLDAITRFTLDVFNSAAKKLKNPILKLVLKKIMPDAYRYLPSEPGVCQRKRYDSPGSNCRPFYPHAEIQSLRECRRKSGLPERLAHG